MAIDQQQLNNTILRGMKNQNADISAVQAHVAITDGNPHGTTAAQVGAELAGTVASHELAFVHSDIAHSNRTELDAVSGTNTGDQDFTGIYEPANSNIQTHIPATEAHGATGAVVGTTNGQTLTNKTLNDNTNYIDSDAVHQIFYNNSGGTLIPGSAVVNTQWNATNSATEVVKARANSGTTCPCHGLVEASTADNAIGSIRTHGILTGVDTSAWSEGADLWLSPTTAGILTVTMPTTVGQYQQSIGTVVKQHATTGIIAVNIGPALLIAPAGGIGSFAVTQITVDFGATPMTDKEFTITDAAVSATSKIVAVMAYEDTTDHTADEVAASGAMCAAGKAGTGSFTLSVYSLMETLSGTYKINYVVG